VDAEAAGEELPVLVPLGALEDQDVLVAGMVMQGDFAAGAESEEGGGGSGQAIAVKTVNFHAWLEGLPGDAWGPVGGTREIQAVEDMVKNGLKGVKA
jgi:hypothetical protein